MTRARRVLYPGTFDPITNGHLDILERALAIFGRVEVVVARNPQKENLFTLEERIAFVNGSLRGMKNVTVHGYNGLLVNYVKPGEKAVLIRGLRAVSDFEYELQMAMMNRRLKKNVETVFLMPNDKYVFLSSSLVRDIAKFRGRVDLFVPAAVSRALKRKFSRRP